MEKSKSPPSDEKNTSSISAGLTKERFQALKSLGYFDRAQTDNPEDRSVTKEAAPAFDGLNLYNSRDRAEAFLLDMAGNVVHSWSAKSKSPPWMHMLLRPNGDLLVLSKVNYVAGLDWDSNVLWKRPLNAHHDFTVAPDGRILVLAHRVNRYDFESTKIPIMDDYIVVLSPTGEIQEKHRLFPLIRELVSRRRLNGIKHRVEQGVATRQLTKEGAPSDTTHTNSIQIMSQPIPSIAPAGSILLSCRELNRIVILNADMSRLLWSWGEGELQGQHHATHLDNGHIMVFDNGIRRKQSRVVEMNPITGQIVWSYTAPDFFTRLRGAAQKLPNGNVLATESDRGHAFEVTRERKTVWEFWNPDVRGERKPTRAVIYRLIRYPRGYLKRPLPEAGP